MSRPVDGYLIAAALAPEGLVVKPATLRQWAARGHISQRGRDTAGRVLYDLREVQSVARARLAVPGGRRAA